MLRMERDGEFLEEDSGVGTVHAGKWLHIKAYVSLSSGLL